MDVVSEAAPLRSRRKTDYVPNDPLLTAAESERNGPWSEHVLERRTRRPTTARLLRDAAVPSLAAL